MIGWKVVSYDKKGGLQSARMMKGRGGWGVSYAVGKRTVGKRGTPVLAFRTLGAAHGFSGDVIFKAELENPRPVVTLAFWLAPESFVAFWKSGKEAGPEWATPFGTLACDAITLLEPA